jgi:hypothetical protein
VNAFRSYLKGRINILNSKFRDFTGGNKNTSLGMGWEFFSSPPRPDKLRLWVLGALSPGVNRQRLEADYAPPSSAEVTNALSYTSTPPIRLHGVVLS